MNYNKFHKLIEEQNPEQKEEFYLKLKEKLNIPDEQQKVEEKKQSGFVMFFKKPYRIIACVSAVLVIICLSVFIPFALKNKTPAERYCYEKDCIKTDIKSIKDYTEKKDLLLLYLDWYENGELHYSSLYADLNNSDRFVYIAEEITNNENGELVKLCITDNHTKVDIFERFWELCNKVTFSKDIHVMWHYKSTSELAFFEYEGYRYYIELYRPASEEAILDIVAEMLP